MSEIVRLLGHSAGGRPSERLLTYFGMAVSNDTVLRHLKRSSPRPVNDALRVVAIDDWSRRKGQTFGTIMVDLERRAVVDVLADRSSSSVAAWFSARPSIEIISRDRQGLYAEGGRLGAPQARQVADRFHLVQNLREMIEKQLGRLERPVSSWRRKTQDTPRKIAADPMGLLARDPATGRQMSPQIAASLCIKPRGQLTPRQAAAVDARKTSSTDFSVMRTFAMRSRGILRSRDGTRLDPRLDEAYHSGI